MSEEIDRLQGLRQAIEARIDIRPLVAGIIEGYDGLEGLAEAAVHLAQNAKNEQSKVRLMIEFLGLVKTLTQPGDDLPENVDELEAEAKRLMK